MVAGSQGMEEGSLCWGVGSPGMGLEGPKIRCHYAHSIYIYTYLYACTNVQELVKSSINLVKLCFSSFKHFICDILLFLPLS